MSARVDGAANKARRLSTPQAPEGRGRRRLAGLPKAVQCSAVHYETAAEKRGEKKRRSGQAALSM